MRQKATESDLAKTVITMLREQGWEIYQEVEGPGGRADIVAVRGKIQWAIECKMSFGLAVIEQAHNWTRHCHYSSIAVPRGPSWFGRDICKSFGIGILSAHVWPEHYDHVDVNELVRPKLNRKVCSLKLHEEQKTFCAAGGNRGGHWTPFKRTIRNLISRVHNEPGIEFEKLIKVLDHHYGSNASAKSCLRNFIGSDVIPELKIEMVGRKLCVFPADKKDPTLFPSSATICKPPENRPLQ
jgi:hypothetical protein